MTIADLKAVWRDLPDETEVYVLDPRGKSLEYRTCDTISIERDMSEGTDSLNITLKATHE